MYARFCSRLLNALRMRRTFVNQHGAFLWIKIPMFYAFGNHNIYIQKHGNTSIQKKSYWSTAVYIQDNQDFTALISIARPAFHKN